MEIDQREVKNHARVDTTRSIFLEAKLLHHGYAEHIVAQFLLVNDEGEIARILSEED